MRPLPHPILFQRARRKQAARAAAVPIVDSPWTGCARGLLIWIKSVVQGAREGAGEL